MPGVIYRHFREHKLIQRTNMGSATVMYIIYHLFSHKEENPAERTKISLRKITTAFVNFCNPNSDLSATFHAP